MAEPEFDFDLFVIGGGSGGVRAARIAAQAGAKVALAEEYRMGGTCVIRGCVPKKLMVYASSFSELLEDAKGFGWDVGPAAFDWAGFKARRDAEIDRLEGIYRTNLGKAGVEIFDERASLSGAHEVALAGGRKLSAKVILIATGGWPFVPEFSGSEHALTSNDLFLMEHQPSRALVVGGGYIACEFAGILNGLGTRTTQFYRGAHILRGFDHDVQLHVSAEMRKKGIDLQTHVDVETIEKTASGFEVTTSAGAHLEVDAVFYATGRLPNSMDLGLEALGVSLSKNGAIEVDKWSQTAVPSIFAVGDVTDRVALTPVAIREGQAFAETMFAGTRAHADHDLIPTAVFTQPEIGTVGLTQEEAEERGEVLIYRTDFKAMYHGMAGRDERMLMKLVVCKETDVVLGVHIVGHGAGEMIQTVGIAVKMGATKAQFDATVAVHPTAAEELVTLKTPVS